MTDCCSCLYQLLYPGFPPLPLLPVLSCLLTPLSMGPLRASSCPWSTIVGSLRTSPAHEIWRLPCTAPSHAPATLTSPQHSHQCLHLDVDMKSQMDLTSDVNSYSSAHHRLLSLRWQLCPSPSHSEIRHFGSSLPRPPSSVRRFWWYHSRDLCFSSPHLVLTSTVSHLDCCCGSAPPLPKPPCSE